jgi:hypothetical protein
MFLLLIGLVGGGAKPRDILLAGECVGVQPHIGVSLTFGVIRFLVIGITGAIAGAISMALGEYIATKSQVFIFSIFARHTIPFLIIQ